MRPAAPGLGGTSPGTPPFLADRVLAISGFPLALVALTDERGDWSWSLRGSDPTAIATDPGTGATGSRSLGLDTPCPQTTSLALQTLLHRRPWLVDDALEDPQLGLHPAVVGSPWVRRLVGLPVLARDGRVLGCLCAIDFEPRPLSPERLQSLEGMATALAHTLERQELSLRLRQLRRLRSVPSSDGTPQPAPPDGNGPWLLSRQVCLQGLGALFRLGAAEGIALLRLECLAVEGYVTALGVEGLAVLMAAVAEGIGTLLPPQASFCRYAEEEFLLLVPQVPDLASLSALAARLVAEVSATPYRIGHETLSVALAVGATLLDGSQPDLGSALAEVGVARRLAAASPGGGFRLVDAVLRRQVRDDFSRQSRFREGLLRGALLPHFQPIVDLISGRTRGFEALARWRTPEGEVQGPGEYLAVAQQLGLNGELDLAVIRQALDSLPALAAATAGGIPAAAGEEELLMSVNISAQLLERQELCEQLLAMLAASPPPPGWRLQVEILEESMQLSEHRLDAVLSRLAALRVGVAIDDFGTGYSSLARLHTLPIQAFKIDRSFVERINDPIAPSNQLLHTMNTLAIDLGLAATAEGVGSPQQCDWLRRNGFLSGQGFHFAQPLSLDQAIDHLRQQATPPSGEVPVAPVPLAPARPRSFWRRLGLRLP
jgi:EAL domain-containing protein (putative c-di-GMP-specific phosphodiesterase class I)